MIPALLATVVYGVASAFLPAIPAEPYVIGLMATTDLPAVPVGVAVAIGQTVGKVLIFLAVRGLIRAPWLQRWIGKRMPSLARKDASVPAPRKRRTADRALPAPRGAGEPGPTGVGETVPTGVGETVPAPAGVGETVPAPAGAGAALPGEAAGPAPNGTAVGAPAPNGTAVGLAAPGGAASGGAAPADGPREDAAACADAEEPAPGRGRAIGRALRAGIAKLVALLDRPVLQAPIVLLSAVAGLPPLLLVSAYAARTRMTTGLFAAVCLLGRSIRFVAIAYAPGLVMD